MTVDFGLIATDVLADSRFVAMPPHLVRVSHVPEETVRWEIFLGHLLDPAATRRSETFACWHVFLDGPEGPGETPLITVRWNQTTGNVYVTRQILMHSFEAYEESPGVIGTRPAQKWIRELVGTIQSSDVSADELKSNLARLVYLAVAGISRLPITSLESPLPCFSLGWLGYFPTDSVALSAQNFSQNRLYELLRVDDTELAARALEFALRGQPLDDQRLLAVLGEVGAGHATLLVQRVFNQAALSPHTEFADRLVRLIERLADESWFEASRALNLLGFMLRQLYRHLTAFDLTLFHNFGANYPDALFLDALLKATLRILHRQPDLGLTPEQRLLRRALRAGMLLRKHYEGLRVPDAPTSMGENTRVLPAPFTRVPDEQITEHGKRRRMLFADDPTDGLLSDRTRPILEMSFQDLDNERELQELGTALFLDRPLGALKQAGEVDRTPLVSYTAFSRLIAIRRLATAKSAKWIDEDRHAELRARVSSIAPAGLIAAELQCIERPGVVCLTDANKAAADFVILRSTRGSLTQLLAIFDWQPLASRCPALHGWLFESPDVLFIQQRDVQSGRLPRFEFYHGGELQFVLSPRTSRSTMAAYREYASGESLSPLALVQARDASGRLSEIVEPAVLIHAR